MKKYENFCMKLSSINSINTTNNNNADIYWMDSLRPNNVSKKPTINKNSNLNTKNKKNLKSNNIVNILDKTNNNNITRNLGQKLLKLKNRTNSTNISRSTSISLNKSQSTDKNSLLLKKINKNNSTILNNKNSKKIIISSAYKPIQKRNLNISLSCIYNFTNNTTIKENINNTVSNNNKEKNINNNEKKNISKNTLKNYYLETESSSMKRNFGRAIKDKPKKVENFDKNLTERNFFNLNNNKKNSKKLISTSNILLTENNYNYQNKIKSNLTSTKDIINENPVEIVKRIEIIKKKKNKKNNNSQNNTINSINEIDNSTIKKLNSFNTIENKNLFNQIENNNNNENNKENNNDNNKENNNDNNKENNKENNNKETNEEIDNKENDNKINDNSNKENNENKENKENNKNEKNKNNENNKNEENKNNNNKEEKNQETNDKKNNKIDKNSFISFRKHSAKLLDQEKILSKFSFHKRIKKVVLTSKPGKESIEDTKNKINQDNFFISKFPKFNMNFIGVCDGHGNYGHLVSEFIKTNLPKNFESELNKKFSINQKIEKLSKSQINKIFNNTFLKTNIQLQNDLNIDTNFSGSTCSSIFFTNTNLIYSINVGDSRAILIKKVKNTLNDFEYEELTTDHKLNIESEKNRILKYGGLIHPFKEDDEYYGPDRIWIKNKTYPGIAMSRSFGDTIAQTVGLICEPDVKSFNLQNEDKIIIIASDGLYQYLNNEDIVDIIKDFYKERLIFDKNEEKLLEILYETAKVKWEENDDCIDDITIILVFLE